jgi:hypothetical protein
MNYIQFLNTKLYKWKQRHAKWKTEKVDLLINLNDVKT